MDEEIIKKVARWGLTLLVLFILFALNTMPLTFFNLGEIRPAFILIAIYYMTILRPDVMPYIIVFFLGLSLDLISSYPLGLNALILVSVQWLVKGQRRFLMSQSFKFIWAGFFIVALVSGVVQWLVFSIFNFSLYSLKPVFFSVLFSGFIFPLVALPLSLMQKSIEED